VQQASGIRQFAAVLLMTGCPAITSHLTSPFRQRVSSSTFVLRNRLRWERSGAPRADSSDVRLSPDSRAACRHPAPLSARQVAARVMCSPLDLQEVDIATRLTDESSHFMYVLRGRQTFHVTH
jgi:hypothetical protein